jgi:hypothetical protein
MHLKQKHLLTRIFICSHKCFIHNLHLTMCRIRKRIFEADDLIFFESQYCREKCSKECKNVYLIHKSRVIPDMAEFPHVPLRHIETDNMMAHFV